MTTNETIEGLQEIIDRNKKTILPRVHIGYLIHAVKYLKEQKAEIENLKQTAQSMMEGVCLLKEQETANVYKCPNCGTWVSAENVVRCKDCKYRGKSEKCVLSAISEEKDYPLFMLDNRGEWFCADGRRKD